jgi:hypothetical protein
LASQTGFERYARKTRREQFLDEMERVVPWVELEALMSVNVWSDDCVVVTCSD